MEYKMLASQTNPHFLYNTLETIRMKAFAAGNREVAKAIKLLGKSLRYVLDSTGTVSTTLAKEIDYLRIYFSIQKLRFEDRIEYTIKIQEGLDLENYQILPLLLQPIVENAVSHGLENIEEHGQVLLNIYVQDDTCLCIDISDNGIGMTEEELARVRKNISEKDTSRTQSIGLYNINQRILLCYGPEYSLNASRLLNRRFFCEPNQHVLGYGDLPPLDNSVLPRESWNEKTMEYSRRLTDYIQTQNRTRIAETLKELESNLYHTSMGIPEIKHYLIDIYLQVKQNLTHTYSNMDVPFSSNATIIDDILYYINHNYRENLKLETIAPLFGYNSSYLGKIFTREVGETFNSYLDRIRIERSQELLRDRTLKVYEIAEKVGYKNVDYFHKKFKKLVGESPAEYRKKL